MNKWIFNLILCFFPLFPIFAGTTERAPPKIIIDPVTLNFAQTHVIPPLGLTWNLPGYPPDQQRTLRLAGNRETLVLAKVNVPLYPGEGLYIQTITSPNDIGVLAFLNPPETFPNTESNGPTYEKDTYWAILPADRVIPGLKVRVYGHSAKGGTRIISQYQYVEVGSSPTLVLRPVAFYLFGSNPTNYPNTLIFDDKAVKEYFSKVPVSKVELQPFPDIIWDYIVVPPSTKDAPGPAFVLTSADDMDSPRKNEPIDAGGRVLNALQEANGEKGIPHYFYGGLLIKYRDGNIYYGGGAGFQYDNAGIGDSNYGVFFHEIGHSFGMPHANDGYMAGQYPYIGGSLLGSAWGYDSIRNIFLAPFVPSDVSIPPVNCTWGGMILQRDDQGRCIKQDPMQGGAGLMSAQDDFAMFSDFNAAQIQWAIDGETTLGPNGTHVYSSGLWGLAEIDPSYKSGFRRWDTIDKKYVEFIPPKGPQNSIYGWNKALPIIQNVPVHAIVVTLSTNMAPGLNQIYPPLHFMGNLIEYINPTDPTQLASINLDTGKYRTYCTINGCDYTLRVTYEDNSQLYRLIPKGFRLGPVDIDPVAQDPNHWASMLVIGVNVPANKGLKKIELLSTPQAYNKTPQYFSTAPVIATRMDKLN
ncbi:TPA: M66 family metalloprotease [Legionella pneumophila]